MAAPLKGYEASLYLIDLTATNAPVFVADTPMSRADDTWQVYFATNRENRWWHPDKDVVVTVTGMIDVPDYTVCHAGGLVRFAEPLEAQAVVTASVWALPIPSKVGGAHSWSLDATADTHDVTCWDNQDGWREYISVMRGGTASFEKWWRDPFFIDVIQQTTVLGLEMRGNDEYIYYAYGQLTSDSVSAATEGVVEESLSAQITGAIGYVSAPAEQDV